MNDLINITISTLSNLADLRYRTERSILEQLDHPSFQPSNRTLAELFQSGLSFTKSAIDVRYNIEMKVLNGIRTTIDENEPTPNPENPQPPSPPTSPVTVEPQTKQAYIPSGTIQISAAKKDQVVIPLNIRNHYIQEQDIFVSASILKEPNLGKELKGKINIDQPQLKMVPNSSTKVLVSISIDEESFAAGEVYQAVLMIKGIETRLFKLVMRIEEENSGNTPKITFVPPTA